MNLLRETNGGKSGSPSQGYQIGRIFAYILGECLLWAFLKITKVAQIIVIFFSTQRVARILTKMGWATFWAIFSQTHPVTLCPQFIVDG
jgi:hypothetical protein